GREPFLASIPRRDTTVLEAKAQIRGDQRRPIPPNKIRGGQRRGRRAGERDWRRQEAVRRSRPERQCRRLALPLFDVLDGAEEIAIGGGFLKVLLFGGGHHALLDAFHKVMAAAVEKHADIAHGFSVAGVGGKAGDAGSEAAVNVILQAGAGMILREIDKTRGNKKALVNEVQDAASEAGRKVGTKIERAVFLDAAREINAGIFFGQSELDIGISLIVAKDDVELGLVLLDEIVFEGEG